MEKNKLIKLIGIYTILHFIGMALSFEHSAIILKIIGYKKEILVTIFAFMVFHAVLNLVKYFISVPILLHLCPDGENSIYFKKRNNSGLDTIVKWANKFLKKTFNLTKRGNPISFILLFILGFSPINITAVGLLLCALLNNKIGVIFVLLGESLRIFLFGTLIL